MVSTKTAKTAKLTYAERTLGAVSSLQKDHRKSVVHLTSIKNQVKKIADTKKDKLGPNWQTWVKKAVHKLKDDGLIALTEPAGTVTMSPAGKKSMADARRSLGITGLPTSDEEDLILKHVTHSGNKRSFSAISASASPRKKARTSLSGSVALSRMRKAELLAEIERLRRENDDTNLDEEREEMLRQAQRELKLKKRLIQDLERQVAELQPTQDDESLTDLSESDMAPTRPATPTGSSTFTFTSPPAQPNLANTLNYSRPQVGVTRTQSGSLLSNLTRRPTPAPSTAGSDDGNFDDFPMLGGDETAVSVSRDRTLGQGHQFATPEPTPSRRTATSSVSWHSREQELLKEIERHKGLTVEAHNVHEAQSQVSHEKITSLSNELFSREAQLKDATTQLSLLQSENDRLKIEVAEKESRLAALQAQLDEVLLAKANTESTYVSRVAELEASAHQLRSASLDATQRISALETELSENVKETEALRIVLQAKDEEVEGLSQQLRAASDELVRKSSDLTDVRQNVMEMQSVLGGLQTELDNVAAQRDEFSAQVEASNVASNELVAQLSASEESAHLLRQDIVGKEEELGQLRTQFQTLCDTAEVERVARETGRRQLQTDLDQCRAAMTHLESSLASAEANVTALRTELETSTSHSGYLQMQLDAVNIEKQRLDEELDTERLRSISLENDLGDAVKRMDIANEEIEALHVSKEADEATIQRLKGGFAALHNAQMKQMEELGRQFEAASQSSPAPKPRRTRPTL